MSNTPVNSPPEHESASRGCSENGDDPEPIRRSHAPENAALEAALVVEVLWDHCVAEFQQRIELSNHQIVIAAREAAHSRGYERGHIGVRITDDHTIHQINAQYLSHDYPTDVISFPYSSDERGWIEGELVASVQRAADHAADANWKTSEELLLYVIHGVLHISGLDDHDVNERAHMRRCESEVLTRLGIDARPAAEVVDRGE